MKLEEMCFYLPPNSYMTFSESKQGKLIDLTPSGWLYEHYSLSDGFGWTNTYRLISSGALYGADLYDNIRQFEGAVSYFKKDK